LNKRIEKINSYISKSDSVADIGCDQAFLAELLSKREIYSIASDIKENIIKNAKKRLSKSNNKYISFIVSDGLEKIPDSVDTLVLSGMGTHTILKILNKSTKQYKKIITISNNNHDILRKEMLKLNYKVDKEEIIFEKNKFYNLILFIPGSVKYSKEEILLGKNHQNIELFKRKLEFDLIKNKDIYELSNDKKILHNIKTIEKKLKCC
jgi:tRNA (adenine22-N1)-methyltransferase